MVSQPVCFAVKGAGGGCCWCEALIELSQAPRMLSLDYFFCWPFGVCFVLSLGSGLSHDSLIHSIAPLALPEEQFNAEVFTAPPVTATVNQMSQARQEIEKLPGE